MECYKHFAESLEEITLISQGADAEIKKRTNEGRLLGNAITRAGLVLLCGYFEGYIRDVVEEFIDTINDNKKPINSLSPPLFCSILEQMPGIDKKNEFNKLDTLKESIINNKHFKIKKEKFGKTSGNPTVDTIESIFSNIGIENVIDKLSIIDYGVESTFIVESQAEKLRSKINGVLFDKEIADVNFTNEILEIIESQWAPKKKRRVVGYVSDIQELLKKRNRIAHGEGREIITPDDLNGYKDKVGKLSLGLNNLTDEVLNTLISDTLPINR
jgi:hypothetical protein